MRTRWMLVGVLSISNIANAACCYFAAKDKDVLQPAQKAFLTYDARENVETFTVQPRFEGNADDFGMVIPTPAQPKLDEMPRDFFKALAVFTILEPMDLSKYKQINRAYFGTPAAGASVFGMKRRVQVLEAGVVGSLDYKIVQAEQADDLFQWLKDNHYQYGGDRETLDFYIKKGSFFTTMKIDPKQMKRDDKGAYAGDVTPTRFTFSSPRLVYPLKITRLSVKDRTEALFYVQTSQKMDLPEDFSWQMSFTPMWLQALNYAIPEKVTEAEKAWQGIVKDRAQRFQQDAQALRMKGREPATLEWARKMTDKDIAVLSGEAKYNRDAPADDVAKMKLLKGHVKSGAYLTKLRKIFTKDEMAEDLVFVPAVIDGHADEIEYVSILPTSPP